MLVLAIGIGVLLVVSVIFWSCLPRNGQTYRFMDTAWPFVAVAVLLGFTLGIACVLKGISALVAA